MRIERMNEWRRDSKGNWGISGSFTRITRKYTKDGMTFVETKDIKGWRELKDLLMNK